MIQATAKFPAGMATTIPPSVSALGYHMRGGVQPLLVHRLRENLVDPLILQGNFATGPIESATHGHCHCYSRSIYTRVLARRSAGRRYTDHPCLTAHTSNRHQTRSLERVAAPTPASQHALSTRMWRGRVSRSVCGSPGICERSINPPLHKKKQHFFHLQKTQNAGGHSAPR